MRLLPSPYPDELVGSVIARGLVRSGLPSDRFLLRLTGRDVGTLSFFLPSDLHLVADAAGVPAEQMLWENTPFPYVVAFMPPVAKHRFAFKALTHTASNGKCLGALVQSCSLGFQGLRFCPQCRDDELRRFGESYWHRRHNLPGVFVCVEHACLLLSSPPVTLGRAYKMGQPNHHQGRSCGFEISDALMELARSSASLLDRSITRGLFPILIYRALSINKGYQVHEQWTCSSQLACDLAQFYGEKLLSACGSGVPVEDRRNPWPALMLRPGSKVPFTPIKHVLLANFLAVQSTLLKSVEKSPPGKKPRDYVQLDTKLACQLRVALTAAVKTGVRVELQELFTATGLWETFRHQRQRLPLSRAVIEEYRQSNAAARQTGRRPRWRKKVQVQGRTLSPASEAAQDAIKCAESNADAI